MIQNPAQQYVDQVMRERHSMRAFLPTPVAREDIEAILDVARWAPSGSNTQPWKVHVLQGAHLAALKEKVLAAHNTPEADGYDEEYHYYPVQWAEPYLGRRRKVGWDLYQLLGITRENKEGMHAQHGRNFTFFDAPVGLMFTIDRTMQQGSWLDYGMFLQNVMLAARARGLDTCAQAAFLRFHSIIHAHLGWSDQEMLVCGMSLGYAASDKVENSLRTERMTLADFVRFYE